MQTVRRFHFLLGSLLFAFALLQGCAQQNVKPPEPVDTHVETITPTDLQWIANQIDMNETSGKPEHIMIWATKEEFLSLGIGHFIWYPAGQTGPYDDTFPALLTFMKSKNVPLPSWLANRDNRTAPWVRRDDFLRAERSPQVNELRNFLLQTKVAQADFIIQRLKDSFPEVLNYAPQQERAAIQAKYDAIARSQNGMYPLVDYVNFKGKGTTETERYNGQGWGLLQVLQTMRPVQPGSGAIREFANAAEFVLKRRLNNSPPERNEQQYLRGWMARLATYR